ncbi:unnamed protein product [Prorocentrum cordatum]|uniref:Apple domain-containing protein n=1 Tax=Prorocentrum cordatum TaxID=2364126 RepID=A0ABN9P835_9DINO|nr:unnamed protein product [Polarella glacialis]
MSGSNKCTGWTVTNNNECYLKTSVGDMQSDAGVQGSGYCYPSCGDQQNQQNNDGHNYEGPIQVQNAEFCKVRCQASGGQCKGWTVTNNGECYLKDSVGPMRPDGGGSAGQRQLLALRSECFCPTLLSRGLVPAKVRANSGGQQRSTAYRMHVG